MTSKERLNSVLHFGVPDRVPMVDISYWPTTLERWREEGITQQVHPAEVFGLDRIGTVMPDCSFRFETQVLQEEADYTVETDSYGATMKKWKEHYAPPQRLEWRMKTADDWHRFKERLQVEESRFTKEIWEAYRAYKDGGLFVVIAPAEPCWFFLENAFGFDNLLTGMVEKPALIHDMLDTYTEFVLDLVRLGMRRGMEFDAFWFFSDLCYKNGMLFSPRAYREFLMPCHKRVSAFCRKHDLPLILHCDGDVREFVPLLIEAGFDCIQPLEARCGNDVREMKGLYGNKIVFFGNISVEAMSEGGKRLEEEVRTKVTAAKEGGGYIYHSDHSVPPTVSLDNYRRTIELVREYGEYY